MHIIWKRPDGYHGASPSDFSSIELGGHSRLWLHKSDSDQYPFQISGGWEGHDGTVLLNNLVNLIPCEEQRWLEYLNHQFDHSLKDNRRVFLDGLMQWIDELSSHIKGDTWEVDILNEAFSVIKKRLSAIEVSFLSA